MSNALTKKKYIYPPDTDLIETFKTAARMPAESTLFIQRNDS